MKREWLVGFSSAGCKKCDGVIMVNRRIVHTKFSRRPTNSLGRFTPTKIPELNLFPAAADLRWPLSIYGPLHILEPRLKTLNKFPIIQESRGDWLAEYLIGETYTCGVLLLTLFQYLAKLTDVFWKTPNWYCKPGGKFPILGFNTDVDLHTYY